MLVAQKSGKAVGIVSICSAHPHVLRAAVRLAVERDAPLLVESTCNQVNQEGGYTGMTPEQFSASVKEVAAAHGLPPHRLILGGDHLGPYPWQGLPAALAMEKARQMVVAYVGAGYTKIHLDASMRCADDPPGPLSKETIAERAADLCLAAEEAASLLPAPGSEILYVMGTEVPTPGGALEQGGMQVTSPQDAAETLELTRSACLKRSLEAAWERLIALVVQPGVEFGEGSVHLYDRSKARALSALIERHDGMVYEAHSTDYQSPQALRQLVEDHFAILKVGPALTFAFREAAFALAWMEGEWLASVPGVQLSRLPEVLDEAMRLEPRYWQAYYQGDERQVRLARRYSLSDRIRYYWSAPSVQSALSRLISNLEAQPPPLTLLSQFLPLQLAKIQDGRLGMDPLEWLDDAVQAVLSGYYEACGG